MINDALRIIRTFSGMSQTELAKRLGVTKSWISEIEGNHKTPTLALLEGYARLFDIPLSSIVFFSEEIPLAKRGDRAQAFVSKKILAILDFIAADAEDGADDEEGGSDIRAKAITAKQVRQP